MAQEELNDTESNLQQEEFNGAETSQTREDFNDDESSLEQDKMPTYDTENTLNKPNDIPAQTDRLLRFKNDIVDGKLHHIPTHVSNVFVKSFHT